MDKEKLTASLAEIEGGLEDLRRILHAHQNDEDMLRTGMQEYLFITVLRPALEMLEQMDTSYWKLYEVLRECPASAPLLVSAAKVRLLRESQQARQGYPWVLLNIRRSNGTADFLCRACWKERGEVGYIYDGWTAAEVAQNGLACEGCQEKAAANV